MRIRIPIEWRRIWWRKVVEAVTFPSVQPKWGRGRSRDSLSARRTSSQPCSPTAPCCLRSVGVLSELASCSSLLFCLSELGEHADSKTIGLYTTLEKVKTRRMSISQCCLAKGLVFTVAWGIAPGIRTIRVRRPKAIFTSAAVSCEYGLRPKTSCLTAFLGRCPRLR